VKVLSRLRRAGDGEPAEGAEQLRRIEAVSDAALAHLHLDDLLPALLERVCETLEVDTGNGVRIPLGKGFAGRIADEGHAVILEQA
jgi:phosphoserine phosphatase RsbU/P